MAQGFLFEPERVARAELQRSIVRLDLAEARKRLQEFRLLWPDARLSWEPELIRIGEPLLSRRLDLDSGFREWNRLHRRLVELEVPDPGGLWSFLPGPFCRDCFKFSSVSRGLSVRR